MKAATIGRVSRRRLRVTKEIGYALGCESERTDASVGELPPTGTAQMVPPYRRARDQLVTAAIASLPEAACVSPPSWAARAPRGSLPPAPKRGSTNPSTPVPAPTERNRIAPGRRRHARRRPCANHTGHDSPRGGPRHTGAAAGVTARDGEHVRVAPQVCAHLHMAALGAPQPAVEEDPLRARIASPSDHVPQEDASRRTDHRGGVSEHVALRAPRPAP